MNAAELTAAYVLGELDGPELADFERRLAADPELRAEVKAARGTIAELEALSVHAWPGEEPVAAGAPTAASVTAIGPGDEEPRDSLAAAAADRPPSRGRQAPSDRRTSGGHRALTLRPSLVAALLAAVFVLGGVAGALVFSGGDSSLGSGKTVLVLHPLDAPRGSRADISMPAADTMLLRAHGLPASPAGSYYEVWLMSNDRELVPVASFRVGASGEASVEVPLPAPPTDYRYFDVSRQSVAAGLGHSADSVLRGSTGGLS